MMTLAKALGNGFPIGALLATDKIAAAFVPGSHGSTFGGNPLACAAALATLETIMEQGILDNCRKVGEYFLSRLGELKEKHPVIREVRGRGLILAIELTVPGAEFVTKCMGKGLLINCANGNVLRFVPPLILTRTDVDRAVGILDEALEEK
jgi:acetylornithine/N-succinyldiaminopimelate aminotransferase